MAGGPDRGHAVLDREHEGESADRHKASSERAPRTLYSRGRVSGLPMPFPKRSERLLNKKMCMNCSARNPPKAVQCRRCGYKGLRVKSRERSGKTA